MFVFLACLGFVWFFILFLHTLFKTCMFHPYISLADLLGLDIRPFVVHWHTTRFNRCLNNMGLSYASFMRKWFNVGVFVTCLMYIPCIYLFRRTVIVIFQGLFLTDDHSSDMLMAPVIPGINFPTSKLLLYFMVLLVCSVLHEFGHALAASREGIPIDFCGFAVYGIIPVAFVNVRSAQFGIISKWQQMRIFCGGIWHNIVIVLGAFLILSMFPALMSPLYYTGSGVSVVKVHEQSGLNNLAGLATGDHIYKLGDCDVEDMDSWWQCLEESRVRTGLCVPKYLLVDYNNKDMVNCSSSLDSLYFTSLYSVQYSKTPFGVCLKARTALNTFPSCDQKTMKCKKNSLCIFPALEKFQVFTSISRHGKPLVLYVGSMEELKNDVTVTNFFPKFKFVPPVYAHKLKEFLEYLLMFSSGLAFFNLIPALGLDGEYIVETLIHMCLSGYLPRIEHRRYLFSCIRICATIFVIWWLCVIIFMILKQHYF